jgi:hypothetical protein
VRDFADTSIRLHVSVFKMDVDAEDSMGTRTLGVKFCFSYHSELIATLAEINQTFDVIDPDLGQILNENFSIFSFAYIQVSIVFNQKIIHAFVVDFHVLD